MAHKSQQKFVSHDNHEVVSDIARGRVRTTSRNMVTILQLIDPPRHAALHGVERTSLILDIHVMVN